MVRSSSVCAVRVVVDSSEGFKCYLCPAMVTIGDTVFSFNGELLANIPQCVYATLNLAYLSM